MSRTARSESKPMTLSVTGLMVWVAGLGALVGLIEEVIRKSKVEAGASLVGIALVIYLIYVSFSVRAFWNATRLIVPTTLLIGGVLWTIAIQLFDRDKTFVAIAGLIAVPFLTAFLIRWIFFRNLDPEDGHEDSAKLTTVHTLLFRSKGFGSRSKVGEVSSGANR